MEKTPFANLYKWDRKDTKQDTIVQMAENSQKIDEMLNDHHDRIELVEKSIVSADENATKAREISESVKEESAAAVVTAGQANVKATDALGKATEAKELVDGMLDGSVDTGVLNTNIEKKLNELEAAYAPKLTQVTQQLAETVKKGQVSVSDIDKNKGKLDQTYMSDEFLQQITGNTPVNAIPSDQSITTLKLVDDSVSENKVSFVQKTHNLIDLKDTLYGYKITSTSNGELIADPLFAVTDFIEIKPNTVYSRSVINAVYFYDSNKTFISRNASATHQFTTPANAKYLRTSAAIAALYGKQINVGDTVLPFVYGEKKIKRDILPKDEASISVKKSNNLFNKNNLFAGDGSAISGITMPSNEYFSDFTPVKPNQIYSKNDVSLKVFYYDHNKNPINAASLGNIVPTFTTPHGTRFVKMGSNSIGGNDSLMVNEGSTLLPYEDFAFIIESSKEYPVKLGKSISESLLTKSNRLQPYPSKLNHSIVSSNYRHPVWMSDDGEFVYNFSGARLSQSKDDGTSWVDIKTDFPGVVTLVRTLKDGQLLVGVRGTPDGLLRGHLLKSTNYDRNNPSGTLFKKVLDLNMGDIYVSHSWGISMHNNIICINEYGSKSLPNNARYSYMSEDHGDTFVQTFDLGAVEGAHLHGICYDPWYQRIYIANGDSVSNRRIRYSDDKGANWTVIETAYQPVTMYAFESGIIMATDTYVNGILRVPRTKKSDIPKVEVAYSAEQTDVLRIVGQVIYQKPGENNPAFISFTTAVNGGAGLVLATMDGVNFYEVFRDSMTYASQKGVFALVGPTKRGRLVGSISDDRQAAYSKLIADVPVWGREY